MTSSHRRHAGRPSASLLTVEKITQAALELLEKSGDFTMSQLAHHLEVAPSSLYNHVTSRDSVLASISDRVVQSIDTSTLEEAAHKLRGEALLSTHEIRSLWVAATERWAYSYRQAFSLAPSVVTTLALTPVREAPATLAMYERVTSSFTMFGMSPKQALLTVEALEAFLLGSALDMNAPSDIYNPHESASDHPTMASAYKILGATPQDQAFSIGLQAMLTGLAQTLI